MERSLSRYEEWAMGEVEEHRRAQLARSPRRLVPAQVRKVSDRAATVARNVPGAERVQGAYMRAAEGLTRAASKAGQATITPDRVVRAYKRRGYAVDCLEDIRALDLEVVERRVHPRRKNLAYSTTAFAGGAVSGGVITGGEALFAAGSVAGAGAGGVPGVGTVATAIAADTAFTLALMNRAITHTALYYGYDTSEPSEAIFAMSVMNLGSATTSAAKTAAYQELSQLTQQLARRATWRQLNERILPRIAAKFGAKFGFKITQRKLGTLVPVAGIAIGAGLNFHLLDSVGDAAYWAYRERFLREKAEDFSLSLPAVEFEDISAEDAAAGEDEGTIDVISIVEETLREVDEPPSVEAGLPGPEGR
ncbi:EcsC family protein [Georgenia wutianyii]|uniref:EcsC family protein n=1 Tax=Georgenia wutianyii TaxID=2585135 RepID=A0ABX5VM58_9MICO|nr:EcsC family protein [Georgenia wutianyii]QDB79584.1 EcsC family protein [Georgenia wutianyii]